MKWPTMIIHSNFLEAMGGKVFGFPNARAEYIQYLNKFKESIPDCKNNLQAIAMSNSCHTDYGDQPCYA